MENNKKILNVPNLRFPEFKNEWISSELNSEALFLKGAVLSKNELSESGRPCILYGQLYTTYKNETIDEVISKTNCKDKNLFIGKSNDVIIPASGETSEDISTACCVLPDGVLFGGDLNVIRANHNGSFLSYQLNGKRKYDIAKLAVGKSIVHLHNEQLKKLVCTFPPSIQEENKIVSLLNNIDNRIKAQNKIIEHYESLIKGIIDYLFKNIEFENKIELKKISNIYQPQTISQAVFIKNGKYNVYGANGIIGKYNKYNHEDEQILISCRGNCGTLNYSEKFSWINGNAMVINIYDNSILKKYVYYFLHTINFKKIISGSGIPQITKEPLQSLIIPIPASNVQYKIVSLLDLYYKKIDVEMNILNNLNIHKQHLLNNLFI